MSTEIQIRKITLRDSETLAVLGQELGYGLSAEHLRGQIQKVAMLQDHYAYVALRNDRLIGFIHASRMVRLTSQDFVEICALVVAKDERGKGVGKSLVEFIEEKCHKGEQLRVRCNTRRNATHRFYEQMDYGLKKEQKVFEKHAQTALYTCL